MQELLTSYQEGQLVLVLKGGVICEVSKEIWMVPPYCAVWVPGQILHSMRATANACMYCLFIKSGVVDQPDQCCTFSVSPLLRELILYLAKQPDNYEQDAALWRIVDVLPRMPVGWLHLPVSNEPRIRRIAEILIVNPADRRTLAEWADFVTMSERSFARLLRKETGLTFGRWRQQLHLIIAMQQHSAGATVQQVSGELGYESVTAFITMFKKTCGKSPRKYFSAP